MSTFVKPPLDFIVVKENWGRYDLSDGAILKVKIILTRIHKNGNTYSTDFHPINLVLSNELGQPDSKRYTPAELQAAVIQDDMGFNTISQDWNEYVADDGTRVKIQPVIMKIAKTSKFNNRGERVYLVDIQATIQIKPPNPTGA